jgi:hypothetical protein
MSDAARPRDVFVSYSQQDYACAMELVNRLEREGIDCWIAPRNIAPAAAWGAEVIDAIGNSRTMVLVFSASSNRSAQVRREVEKAVHQQVSILPFRIDNILPSKGLEGFLSARHWMDAFAPPRAPHYARLCAYLKAQRRPEAPDAAATQPVPVVGGAPSLDPAEVRKIERLLAGYLGPIAKHLVRAAAARTASAQELVGTIALELQSETDRHEFTRRWRTELTRNL